MGELIYGVDFRKHLSKPREKSLEEIACEFMGVTYHERALADTAPCEYQAPDKDPA